MSRRVLSLVVRSENGRLYSTRYYSLGNLKGLVGWARYIWIEVRNHSCYLCKRQFIQPHGGFVNFSQHLLLSCLRARVRKASYGFQPSCRKAPKQFQANVLAFIMSRFKKCNAISSPNSKRFLFPITPQRPFGTLGTLRHRK